MQRILVGVASTCVNMAIRFWMKDEETYIVNNLLDVSKLVKKIGCDFFSERYLDRNINDYINSFAEKLYSSKILEGIDTERKEEILRQLIEDINTLDLTKLQFAKIWLNDDNLYKIIADNSSKERMLWSDREQGVYNNLVRCTSDAITSFVSELPDYSANAIKVLYQNNNTTLESIAKQIDNIIKIIDSTGSVPNDYRNFETDYLRKICRKNQKIEIFGSGLSRGTKRYDISTSYIELSCSERNYEENQVELSSILEKHAVFWISGEAGSGKTTFVQWLTTHGIVDKSNCLEGLIPIFVKLRNCSFPIHLEEYIQKELGLTCPDGWIDYLLRYDKLLLLLDGLDEISSYDREDVYRYVEDDILSEISENGKKDRIKSKIIITTRPYVEDTFEINHGNYKILRMKTKNIEKFVSYWYKTVVNDEENSKAEKLIENIRKSLSLKTIAGTPLLCAMICALNYVSNETIPTNKNELYEKCCVMLIQARDAERRIEANNEELNKLDYTKKRILLSEISLYMLKCEKVEIEKSEIVSYVKEYIQSSTLIAPGSIKENTVLLIDYLVQRTGILREPAKEKIDYIHKTFMEYLAAKAIARNAIWNLMEKNLINPFWKEAIIMCFNLMSQDIATETLRVLLKNYGNSRNEEFLFMASLCAQNAADIKVEISKKIDKEIQKLIPPTEKYINRLASAGTYIIPFLDNKKIYSDEQRKNCLLVLDLLIQEEPDIEAVNILESYLMYDCKSDNVNYVAYLLLQYPNEILEEYEIGERIYKGICNSISKNVNCITSWEALYLCNVSNVEGYDLFGNIKSLTIQNHYNCMWEYIDQINNKIYNAFVNVTEITIEDIVYENMIDCISNMPKIEKITLQVLDDTGVLLDCLQKVVCAKNIKELEYYSEDIRFICDKDLEIYQNLEKLKLEITNPMIEIELYNWDKLSQLHQVDLVVSEDVYWELEGQVKNWKILYPNIEFKLRIGE